LALFVQACLHHVIKPYVSAESDVISLKESIKARNQLDWPANRLVVWKCNGLKVPGCGESLQLEERLRSIDFLLLVQVPGTANDNGGEVTRYVPPIAAKRNSSSMGSRMSYRI
jgi:hypothetical protein